MRVLVAYIDWLLRKGVRMLGNYPEFARPAVKAVNDKFKVVLEQSEKLFKTRTTSE